MSCPLFVSCYPFFVVFMFSLLLSEISASLFLIFLPSFFVTLFFSFLVLIIFSDRMRAKMLEVKGLEEEPYVQLAVDFFNIISGSSKQESFLFWTHDVKTVLTKKFYSCCLTEEEKSENFHLKQMVDEYGISRFFARIQV